MPRDVAFSTPLWMASAHVQTLGATLPFWAAAPSPADAKAESLTIPLPAGGDLRAEAWWHSDGARRRTVMFVHGVGGSSESKYVLRAGMALFRAGYHVVRLNMRGAGEGIWDAPSLAHAGLTEDPRVALDALGRDKRVDGLVLVGFSLGGNTSLKLAGEWGSNAPSVVRGVASVSAPLDLDKVCRALERWRNLPYRAYVLRALIQQGLAFARIHPHKTRYDVRALRRLTSLRDYDELVIAPMHGFENADDYYARASAGPWLPSIEIPTLILHAEDDPMVPSKVNAPWLALASSSVRVVESKRGGHVGWFSGVSEELWVNNWSSSRVIDFVRSVP